MALYPPTPLEVRTRIHELSRSVHALDELLRVATVPCELLAPLYHWRSELSRSLLCGIGELPSEISGPEVLREEGFK